jgi:hypothetical protein
MQPKNKLIICLCVNATILTVVIALISAFADGSEYWRIGPSADFNVISVTIDNYNKYITLLILIMIINVSKVIVEELGMPVLGFSIYNPDKKVIEDFTKNELQFFANAMFMVSGLRQVFMTVITITQIDIAVWSLLVSEFASFYTIRLLLNEKTFTRSSDLVELTSVVIVGHTQPSMEGYQPVPAA